MDYSFGAHVIDWAAMIAVFVYLMFIAYRLNQIERSEEKRIEEELKTPWQKR